MPNSTRLCGLRPTGQLHVGHYFSVIKPGRAGADVLIANYHAPQEKNLDQLVATLKKFGVEKIKMQRDVFDPELFFRLLTLASFGDLARMPQYKSASETSQTGQLFTYPVLMTHDVVGYDEVLVGEDQKVHLEYAGRLLRKYNRKYPDDAQKLPRANIVGGKVKDLRFPSQKMSKSSPPGCLFLDDPPDVVRKKIKAATMDEAGRENLCFLYKEFVGDEPPESNQKLKETLSEVVIFTLVL